MSNLASAVQIDNSVQQSGFPIGNGVEGIGPIPGVNSGPWKAANGFLYVVLCTSATVGAPPPFTINVFKSINGGASWTQMDAANSPAYGSGASNGSYNVEFNPTTGILTIGYGLGTAANTIAWATFSTVTDTFTAAVYPALTDVWQGPYFAVRNDGSVVLLYQQEVASAAAGVGIRICTAGTWGAFTDITPMTAGHTYEADGLYLDANQTCHLIYDDQPAAGARTFNDRPLSSANALGSVVAIFVEDTDGGAVMGRGDFDLTQTILYLPVVQQNLAGTSYKVQVFAGTPLAAPVYTATTVQTVAGSPGISKCRIRHTGAAIYLAWSVIPAGVIQLRYAVNTVGTIWSTPSVLYDAVLNPPNSNLSQTMKDVNVIVGSLFGLATMLNAAGSASPAFFILPPPLPLLTIRFGGMKVYS